MLPNHRTDFIMPHFTACQSLHKSQIAIHQTKVLVFCCWFLSYIFNLVIYSCISLSIFMAFTNISSCETNNIAPQY